MKLIPHSKESHTRRPKPGLWACDSEWTWNTVQLTRIPINLCSSNRTPKKSKLGPVSHFLKGRRPYTSLTKHRPSSPSFWPSLVTTSSSLSSIQSSSPSASSISMAALRESVNVSHITIGCLEVPWVTSSVRWLRSSSILKLEPECSHVAKILVTSIWLKSSNVMGSKDKSTFTNNVHLCPEVAIIHQVA
jgi:hypothetical protein